MKHIAILGSTGSIGQQTLDVVRRFPEKFAVTGLGGGANLELLRAQLREFHPALYSASARVETGAEYVPMEEMAAASQVDIVVVATAGRAGLGPTLAALKAGKSVALSNKEPLVMAGELVMGSLRAGERIRPVDSEHSAVWQCLEESAGSSVRRVILTASGGPFYRLAPGQLAAVTPEQALRHPTWKMGRKVTIDSATLMNKGLEVIEAHWLFGLPFEKIEVVVHSQSIVHALVEFADGAVKAQLACPDMRLPIQYALSWPERLANPGLPWLDLAATGALTFEAPDLGRFPCLRLALDAGRRGGTYPAVLCAADEAAVGLFLEGRVGFTDIAAIVERTLERHESVGKPGLADILAADRWARDSVITSLERSPRCS